MCDIVWAAGLFAGEGHAGVTKDGRLNASIGMLDHAAIERFAITARTTIPQARVFRKKGTVAVSYNQHIKGGIFARVHLGGEYAIYVLTALLPELEGTLKGEQIKYALTKWEGGK